MGIKNRKVSLTFREASN